MRRGRLNWVLVTGVVLVFTYNVVIALSEAKHPELIASLYLGAAAFVGAYIPLEGQPSQPSPIMAAGLLVALLVTFGAAASTVLRLSQSGLARLSVGRRSGGVVIVGSSSEADAIARSLDTNARAKLVRISEEEAPGAVGTLTVPNWINISDDDVARRVVAGASILIVACSSDVMTARYAAAAVGLMAGKRPFQLVRSLELARALRPDVLSAVPDADAFHVADNVGQVIAGVVADQARGFGGSLRVAFERCGDDASADAILSWLTNSATAARLIGPSTGFEVVGPNDAADLCVLAGTPEVVAATAAHRCSERAVIAAMPSDLLGSVALPRGAVTSSLAAASAGTSLPRGSLLIVDPEEIGLDFRVVTDGLEAQWGRAFHDAYTNLYLVDHPERNSTPWAATGRLGRAEQSSIGAAIFMLTLLDSYGYELKLGQAGWVDGVPASDVVDSMARDEHEEWLRNRTWVDEAGVERRVSLQQDDNGTWSEGPNAVEFAELDPSTKAYNRLVVTKVYPSLAAIFGYGIRRVSSAQAS